MASKSENQRKANSGSSGTSSNANAQSSLDQASHGEKGESGDLTKPSRLKKVWTYLELDMFTILLMAKGGIPPTLALGLLQITAVANHFTTIGYLGKFRDIWETWHTLKIFRQDQGVCCLDLGMLVSRWRILWSRPDEVCGSLDHTLSAHIVVSSSALIICSCNHIGHWIVHSSTRKVLTEPDYEPGTPKYCCSTSFACWLLFNTSASSHDCHHAPECQRVQLIIIGRLCYLAVLPSISLQCFSCKVSSVASSSDPVLDICRGLMHQSTSIPYYADGH